MEVSAVARTVRAAPAEAEKKVNGWQWFGLRNVPIVLAGGEVRAFGPRCKRLIRTDWLNAVCTLVLLFFKRAVPLFARGVDPNHQKGFPYFVPCDVSAR